MKRPTVAEMQPDTNELIDAGFIMLLGTIALYAFEASFGGSQFLVVGMIGVVVGLAVAHIAQRLMIDPLLTACAALVAYSLLVGTFALPEQSTLGFLPSVETIRTSLASIVTGWKRLLTTSPPLGSRSGLLIVPGLCGTIAGVVSLSFARRTKSAWLGLVPVALVLMLGLLCGVDRPVSVLLHGGLFSAVSISWMAVRRHRSRPVLHHISQLNRVAAGAVMLALAAVVGLGVGPSLPYVDASERILWRDDLRPPFDPSLYPSPLNGYRRYLTEWKDSELFTITGLPEGVPVRLAAMDVYDGLVWRVSGATAGTSGLFERVGDVVANDFKGAPATITVRIGRDFPTNSVWVPAVGEVRTIRFGGPRQEALTEAYRYNRYNDVAAIPIGFLEGDEYTMEVVLPTLESALSPATDLNLIPQLPPDVLQVPAVTYFGARIPAVATEGNQVSKALNLGSYMSGNGYYNDPQKTGSNLSSGHGLARLENFVKGEALVGDAEQFAAASAVIATDYLIPVRVVMGFEIPPASWVDGPIVVTGDNAEAWIEIPVEVIGWVAINTTPDRQQERQLVVEEQSKVPERETQVPPPPAIIVPDAPVDPAAGEVGKSERSEAQRDALGEGDGGLSPIVVGALIGLVPVVVLATLIGVILGLKSRRRALRRGAGLPNQRIANGWRELVDGYRDMGRAMPTVATRREAALFVGPGVSHLAAWADAVVFGPGEPDDHEVDAYWAQVGIDLESTLAAMAVSDRWKAKLSLTSLMHNRSAT